MTIEHKDIPEAELHQPKGASTALSNQVLTSDGAGNTLWTEQQVGITATGASADSFFVADGLGSGVWQYVPQGWGRYSDLSGVTAYGTTPALLTIDKLGGQTNETYLPPEIRGTGTLWDAAANNITPMYVGDTYMLRIDLPVTAKSGAPNYLKVQLDIGGLAAPSIVVEEVDLAILSTPPYQLTVVFPVFCLATFVANGGQIFLSTDTGTATVTAPAIFISRESGGNI